jgi:diguanylate cyclase (GGDEF)-like protein
MMSSGLLLFTLGDVLYAFLAGQVVETRSVLSRLDLLLFLWARLAFLAAVLWQAVELPSQAKQSEHFTPLLRSNLVYLAVLSGTGLALVALAGLVGTNVRLVGVLVGAFGITLLVLFRQYFVLQENRRLYREIEQMAITDALTGLSNRRYFDQTLAQEVTRAQRYHSNLALLLLDVDNFKKYNDRYGHPEGDSLLKNWAQLIKSQLRSTDVAARYGGDEFAVILPETDGERGRVVVHRLRQAAEAKLAPHSGTNISIGHAIFQPDMTAADLLNLADQAMYREKQQHAPR